MSNSSKKIRHHFDVTTIDGTKPVRQEDGYGCSVACATFVLNRRPDKSTTDYVAVLAALRARRLGVVTRRRGVWARDLATLLGALDAPRRYRATRYAQGVPISDVPEGAIVFVRGRTKELFRGVGHYVVRCKTGWMCPLRGGVSLDIIDSAAVRWVVAPVPTVIAR